MALTPRRLSQSSLEYASADDIDFDNDLIPIGSAANSGAIAKASINLLATALEDRSGYVTAAVIGGGADDTAPIAEAIIAAGAGGAVRLPAGAFNITSKLTTLYRQRIIGSGSLITILNKAASIDMIELADGSTLENIGLEGNGSNYTGRGVIITEGTQQRLIDCGVTNMNGYCVEWTADSAGANGGVDGGVYWRTTTTNNAMKCPTDTAASNRYISGVDTTGGWLVDTGSCDNLRITNCRFQNMTFGASSAKVIVAGNRISSTGTTMTVNGTSHVVVGNAIAGDITLASGAALCTIQGNTYASGSVTDNSGTSTNMIDVIRVSYTPTWTGSGGNPSIGDGSLTGSYSRNGRTVTVFIQMTAGSTTTFGSGMWSFALPFAAAVSSVGSVKILEDGVAHYIGISYVAGSATTAQIYTNNVGTGIGPAVGPIAAWGTADNITLTISYDI